MFIEVVIQLVIWTMSAASLLMLQKLQLIDKFIKPAFMMLVGKKPLMPFSLT